MPRPSLRPERGGQHAPAVPHPFPVSHPVVEVVLDGTQLVEMVTCDDANAPGDLDCLDADRFDDAAKRRWVERKRFTLMMGARTLPTANATLLMLIGAAFGVTFQNGTTGFVCPVVIVVHRGWLRKRKRPTLLVSPLLMRSPVPVLCYRCGPDALTLVVPSAPADLRVGSHRTATAKPIRLTVRASGGTGVKHQPGPRQIGPASWHE